MRDLLSDGRHGLQVRQGHFPYQLTRSLRCFCHEAVSQGCEFSAVTGGGVQVHLQVDRPQMMDACLVPLRRMTSLLVAVGACILDERQMSQLGDLPVTDLRLISQNYKTNPTLPQPCCSHLENGSVKAYVDAV